MRLYDTFLIPFSKNLYLLMLLMIVVIIISHVNRHKTAYTLFQEKCNEVKVVQFLLLLKNFLCCCLPLTLALSSPENVFSARQIGNMMMNRLFLQMKMKLFGYFCVNILLFLSIFLCYAVLCWLALFCVERLQWEVPRDGY